MADGKLTHFGHKSKGFVEDRGSFYTKTVWNRLKKEIMALFTHCYLSLWCFYFINLVVLKNDSSRNEQSLYEKEQCEYSLKLSCNFSQTKSTGLEPHEVNDVRVFIFGWFIPLSIRQIIITSSAHVATHIYSHYRLELVICHCSFYVKGLFGLYHERIFIKLP